MDISNFMMDKKYLSPAGFEPATFGLEVQRAIHCATGTGWNGVFILDLKLIFSKVESKDKQRNLYVNIFKRILYNDLFSL